MSQNGLDERFMLLRKDEFYTMGESVSGDIHIGGGETYIFRYIVDILKNMQKDYPNIHYHLYSGNAAEVTDTVY